MIRQILAVLIFLLAIPFQAQQVARQKVIVEVGTGTWCPSCPAVVAIIHNLENAGAEIAVVEYHNNDPYSNADSLIRENYYNFPWFPTTYYDSNHIGYDDWATYSVHLSYYQDRINLPSSFVVSVEGEVDALAISGTIHVEKVATYAGENLVFHLALTESNIPENWQGETELDYVERLMYPNGNGTPIDFTGDPNQSVNFNFNLDPSWVASNCEIVYFIQDNDTKEILQGSKITIDELASLSLGEEVVSSNSIVFPNPTTGSLNIKTSSDQPIQNIQIFDIMGRKVFDQSVYSESINLENLTSGMYTLKYILDGEQFVHKVVKR